MAPRSAHPIRYGVPAFGAALALVFVLSGPWRGTYITSLIGAVVCLSLVVLTGYVGQISLAQMAFAGVGGFAVTQFADNLGIPFPFDAGMAIVAATVLGFLVGIPAVRVRGLQLAIVTLALGVAASSVIFENPAYTGGFAGMTIAPPKLFGLSLGAGGDASFGVFVLVILTLSAVVVLLVRRSMLGLHMLAVRTNERAAAAAGINVAATKLYGFGLSAALAGLSGVLLAYSQTTVSYASFTVLVSLSFLAVAYLGGIGFISGAFIGGALTSGGLVFYALDQWIGFGDYQLLVGGLGVLIAAVLNPDGIAGAASVAAGAGRAVLSPLGRYLFPTGQTPVELESQAGDGSGI